MIRLLFLAHRYLGIAVGALMVMWCLSGVVMMYVSYPALGENSRLKGLAPIVWSGCCKLSTEMLADAAGAPLNDHDLANIAGTLNGGAAAVVPELMTQEDTYHFSHHSGNVPLPVYRLLPRDGSGTRYYVDPVSGELVTKIDRGAQGYRWWHEGLHRMDFTAGLRGRPQWDALMLLLMSGVTALCVTGAYLGFRRLVRS
jgi:PepSY-associated TM region